MKRTARIYKGLEVQKESGELYKIDQITAGGTVAAHMFDFEKEEYEKKQRSCSSLKLRAIWGPIWLFLNSQQKRRKKPLKKTGFAS